MLQYNVLYIKHITGARGSMLNFIRGFCMALADSVPGVSGGTVAFLLGFYDKFIMALDHLMSGTKEERIEAIKFLIRIGIGWVVGMGAAVSVLASIFDDRTYHFCNSDDLQRRERFIKRKIPEYHLGSDWSCTCCSNHIL